MHMHDWSPNHQNTAVGKGLIYQMEERLKMNREIRGRPVDSRKDRGGGAEATSVTDFYVSTGAHNLMAANEPSCGLQGLSGHVRCQGCVMSTHHYALPYTAARPTAPT